MRGVDLRTVQELLGHSSITKTMRAPCDFPLHTPLQIFILLSITLTNLQHTERGNMLQRIFYTSLFLLASFSPSLLRAETGMTYERSFDQDGTLRSYLLYVPEGYSGEEDWPLVINYHGFRASPATPPFGQVQISQMNEAADKAGVLVAYPQGLIITNPNNGAVGPGWNVNIGATHDDVAFTSSLIDHIAAGFNVDLSRVHATGWSNGSAMALYLACELWDRIASVAGVSGGLNYGLLDTCQPKRPVSILKVFGTADPLFPADGTELSPPISATPEFFAEVNDCSPDPIVKEFPDKIVEDNSSVTLFRYIRCDDRSQVLYYQVENGGHNWPRGGWVPPFLGNQNMELDASSVILKFFQRNPHPWFEDDLE
jgi:polyhydroxybutyrate depolymerase